MDNLRSRAAPCSSATSKTRRWGSGAVGGDHPLPKDIENFGVFVSSVKTWIFPLINYENILYDIMCMWLCVCVFNLACYPFLSKSCVLFLFYICLMPSPNSVNPMKNSKIHLSMSQQLLPQRITPSTHTKGSCLGHGTAEGFGVHLWKNPLVDRLIIIFLMANHFQTHPGTTCTNHR